MQFFFSLELTPAPPLLPQEDQKDPYQGEPSARTIGRLSLSQQADAYLKRIVVLSKKHVPEAVQHAIQVAGQLPVAAEDDPQAFLESLKKISSAFVLPDGSVDTDMSVSQILNNLEIFERGRRLKMVMDVTEHNNKMKKLNELGDALKCSVTTIYRHMLAYE